MSKSKPRQLTLFRHGGKRRGAGRKSKSERPGVSHARREALSRHHPVLVTLRLRAGLPSLRRAGPFEALTAAFTACIEQADGHGLRLAHFSVQTNHIHVLVEARDERSLSRGMQGLLVRIARGLNRMWQRHGSIFADRYHARILRSPREVRHALAYVLNNAHKHGCHFAGVDPFTSGRAFDGWQPRTLMRAAHAADRAPPVLHARTWLLAHGWRRHGLIAIDEVPGRTQRARRSAGARLLDMESLRRAARSPTA